MEARKCSRCKGSGQARFNHMNGDTHCYLCNGTGVAIRYTVEEKARRAAEDAWAGDAYFRFVAGSGSYNLHAGFCARRAVETQPYVGKAEREAMTPEQLADYEARKAADYEARRTLERRLTWWVDEGLNLMREAQGRERAEAEAAAVRAFRA